jgi:hypothetical protein
VAGRFRGSGGGGGGRAKSEQGRRGRSPKLEKKSATRGGEGKREAAASMDAKLWPSSTMPHGGGGRRQGRAGGKRRLEVEETIKTVGSSSCS